MKLPWADDGFEFEAIDFVTTDTHETDDDEIREELRGYGLPAVPENVERMRRLVAELSNRALDGCQRGRAGE